ncbi:MAG TPA: hypothetical protein VGO58_19500 [Chitinophagaceae bacterium]|jgi:hypothetical protein|nr:hypothetical protein [Chitinophagaceae bacterium]
MHFSALLFLSVTLTSCGGKKQTASPAGTTITTDVKSVTPAGSDTSRYTVIPFNERDKWLFNNAKPAELLPKEIGDVESLLADAMLEHNKMVKGVMVLKPLEKYKLQLVPVTNEKGEKIVYVNCFCGGNANSYFKNWRTELVMVDDGGSCFFNVKINLTTRKSYDLMVNGVG